MEDVFTINTELKPVVTFHNYEGNGVLGSLKMSPEGILSFDGNMDKSAEIFIEHVLKPMWENIKNGKT